MLETQKKDGKLLIKCRGAPAIAIVGCLSLAAELASYDSHNYESKEELFQEVEEKITFLETARPTAVNMKISGNQLIEFSKIMLQNKDVSLIDYWQEIIAWCVQMLEKDVSCNKALSEYGCEALLKRVGPQTKVSVLTHCNTGSLATAGYGTALGMIRFIHSMKQLEHAYCTETRPYNQGARLTAYELVFDRIPSTLICDSMAGALMKCKKVDAVIVGADRVTRNGDTANKIGTYQLSVLAKHHNIPFFVCAPTTSIDLTLMDGSAIEIEQRPSQEMTFIAGVRVAAPGMECWNPAFDVTPAALITGGIVTEKGVFQPHQLYDQLKS